MKEYKKLQIIKHALQHYIERPNASEKDILQETRLLNEVTSKVEDMQDRYGIRRNERA
ncbi:hypothetical protein PZE06_16375 [Robertmurraya sp. DFI.2.37]|uniref:hypothetical protein n=1 Tax=Robertmurraya sp. DFI.2.37 TaxID=3031819 RepID=UPI00177F9933|nr:hypothetical protein [Robertmurraya sp. DFI.2.37]MDF1509717.1 hypothetical protein [Robertmurraya sp. DFI.2.37]